MKQKKSIEDYLKVIYVLSQKKEVHGADIAEDTYERHNTFCQLLTGLGVDEKTARRMPVKWSMQSVRRAMRR